MSMLSIMFALITVFAVIGVIIFLLWKIAKKNALIEQYKNEIGMLKRQKEALQNIDANSVGGGYSIH